MADVVFNPVSGVPFSGSLRMKDLGDTTYAPLSMAVAGPVPTLSLSAVSAVQNGLMLDNTGVRNNHSMVVIVSAGFSTGVVTLQGSQDNVNWFTLVIASNTGTSPAVAPPLTASNSFIYTATLTPVRYLRAAITTVIVGGTISAYVASAG
jgi:hypothetical protein